MDINAYWRCCLHQKAEELKTYFHENAYINWHNTNEHFTVDEFIQANCEYPGKWDGEIQRTEYLKDTVITVVHVFSLDKTISCHVTSFIKFQNDKIISIDEYWGDDGLPPTWRKKKKIGTPIR